jgi:hypothetical protein
MLFLQRHVGLQARVLSTVAHHLAGFLGAQLEDVDVFV